MAGKQRRTKNQKLKASEKNSGFAIKSEWLKTKEKKTPKIIEASSEDKNYFRRDLTKTLVLTMLVLALELALWQYLT